MDQTVEKGGTIYPVSGKKFHRYFRLYDMVRVDHFRGFDEYWSIPAGDKTAQGGHWEKGPGLELFRTLQSHFGRLDIIAEDLGFLTPSVKKLVQDTGFPEIGRAHV